MSRISRRLFSFAVLGALAAQMELPVAHAPAHGGSAGSARAVATQAEPAQALQPAPAKLASAHDPASCPVCQSLHAKPAVPPPVAPERSLPELAPALPALAQRAHDCVTRSGHPPRAPPTAALSLA